jgi:arylsulfatase
VSLGFRFDPSSPGAASGVGTLLIDGAPAGSMTFRRPPNLIWEGMDVGRDTLTPVSREYGSPNPFTGTLSRVVFDLASLPTD